MGRTSVSAPVRGACPWLWAVWLCTLPMPALAQGPPDYDFEWRTIGSPGNTPASPAEFPYLAIDGIGPIGGVDHLYRMARTEVTVGKYLEFVRAYAPYYHGSINDPAFTGIHIYSSTGNPADPRFVAEPGSLNWPMTMTWLNAARYCNWLTNAKQPQLAAFENGAYDMSTYAWDPLSHTWTGQREHSAGALFWIPSVDEWTKGMHFDPDRFGTGLPGYWLFPTSSNEVPVGGPPGTPGAQTSAGDYPNPPDNPFRFYNVGSYPNTQSPWGLLDGSGSIGEYCQPLGFQEFSITGRGTSASSRIPERGDRLDFVGFGPPDAWGPGLRLASIVPSPSFGTFLVVTLLIRTRRRRVS